MLAYMIGVIKSAQDNTIIFETSGIAFLMLAPRPERYDHNKLITIYTYLHWNQENGPSLFGFINQIEKTIFCLLLSCSGLGPKMAIALLHELEAMQCIQAIYNNNTKVLSSVTGIGPKKAELIIAQLRHKAAKLLENEQFSQSLADNNQETAHWHTLIQVLQSLNYNRQEIDHALSHTKIISSKKPTLSFDELLRHTLVFLSKK